MSSLQRAPSANALCETLLILLLSSSGLAGLAAEDNAENKQTDKKTKMKTTAPEMNRVLRDFTTKWPHHENPFTGLPKSEASDHRLYLAAGPHLDGPPLPPNLTPTAARELANKALANARLELSAAMGARMDFNQGITDPVRVRFGCGFPVWFYVEQFVRSECSLPSSDAQIQEWIRAQAQQILWWDKIHDRMGRRPGGLATASLCKLRQLACGFGTMAQDLLEPYWCDLTDTRFVEFHDQVIAEIKRCDFHYTGPMPDSAGEQSLPVAV